MSIRFDLYDLDEALVAKAALDAAIEEMKRQKDAVWVKPCSCDAPKAADSVLFNPEYAAVLDSVAKITAQPVSDEMDTVAALAAAEVVPFTKEEIEEASKFNEELYALVHKKGKKSADQKARMYALTEQVRLGFEAGLIEEPADTEVVEEPVGKVFEGASAADLQALLEATTAPISQTGAVEVRSLLPNFLEDNPAFVSAEPEEPAQVTNSWEQFTDDQLLSQIEDLQQNGLGIHWFKNVVALGGGNWLKMPRDHMIAVLADPDSFTPTV